MNTVDIGILIIMFLSAFMGVMRGLTREVLGLISWLAAAFAAFFTLPLAQQLARHYIQNTLLADGLASISLFIIFLILFSFISQFFAGLVRQSALGGIDRSLGFGYGLLRGFILICFVEMMISIFVSRPEQPAIIRDSHLSSAIYKGSDLVFRVLPLSLQNLLKQQQQKYNTGLSPLPSSLPQSSGSQPTKKEELLTSMLTQHLNQGAQAIIPPTVSTHLPPPSTTRVQQPTGQTSGKQDNTADSQKTVEELARLKPKANQVNDPNVTYSKKQRLDMERLLVQEDTGE